MSETDIAIERYITSIEKDDHRAYAESLALRLPDYRERVAARKAQDEAEGRICYWQMFLSRPDVGKGTGFPTISWAVAEALADDIKHIADGYSSLHHSTYRRHLAKQARRTAARKKTVERQGGFSRPRDSQKSKLYAAEREALEGLVAEQWGAGEVAVIQAWVDKILSSAWWRRRYPSVRKVVVEDGAGHRSAMAKRRDLRLIIELPLWARKDWVVLHELAHHATDAKHWGVAAHGREFARVYVELVEHIMSKEAGDALRAAFREGKVKYSKPRTMTAEQKRAAAERLAQVRQTAARER